MKQFKVPDRQQAGQLLAHCGRHRARARLTKPILNPRSPSLRQILPQPQGAAGMQGEASRQQTPRHRGHGTTPRRALAAHNPAQPWDLTPPRPLRGYWHGISRGELMTQTEGPEATFSSQSTRHRTENGSEGESLAKSPPRSTPACHTPATHTARAAPKWLIGPTRHACQ